MRKLWLGLGAIGLLFTAWKSASPKTRQPVAQNKDAFGATTKKEARNRVLLTVSGTIAENIEGNSFVVAGIN